MTNYVYAEIEFRKFLSWNPKNPDVDSMMRKFEEIRLYFESMVDATYNDMKSKGNTLFPYIADLVHETRSYGSVAINTLGNYAFYRREHPEELSTMDNTIYRNFHRYYLGMVSMEIFYHNVWTTEKGVKND